MALVVVGFAFLFAWPLTIVWPSGWSWAPRQSHSEHMIFTIYAVLGVFLLRAASDPLRHRSLVSFTIWSSVAHAGIMAWQSVTDASERGHLVGDVPVLLLVALALGLLMPREREDATAATTV